MSEAATNPATILPSFDVQDEANRFRDQFSDLWDTLVPPREVTIEDITGSEHELLCVMPAIREIKLVAKLKELLKVPSVRDNADRVMNSESRVDRSLGIVETILGMGDNEKVLVIVSDAFGMAHPQAVEDAVANVKDHDKFRHFMDGVKKPKAMHAFEFTELLAGLAPFAARAVAKGKRAMGTMTSPQTSTT